MTSDDESNGGMSGGGGGLVKGMDSGGTPRLGCPSAEPFVAGIPPEGPVAEE